MSKTIYTLPGMPNWTYQFGDGPPVVSNKGMGFRLIDNMSADDIAENVKIIERYKTFTPDEAAIDVIAQASRNIDWKATEIKPLPVLVAVLINEPQSTNNDSTSEFVDTTALGEEIADLVRKTEQAWSRLRKINQQTKEI